MQSMLHISSSCANVQVIWSFNDARFNKNTKYESYSVEPFHELIIGFSCRD